MCKPLILAIAIVAVIAGVGFAASPNQPFRQISECVQYANPHAIYDSPDSIPINWPITLGWGPVTYVSDTLLDYLDPRFTLNDSIIHVFGTRSSRPHHYTSYDKGEIWQLFGDYYDSSFNIGPGIINAYCEDSNLFTVWEGRRSDLAGFIYYRCSTDNGNTWPITAEVGRDARPEWHAKYPDVAGHRDTVFVSFSQSGDDSLRCWRTTDKGLHWSNRGPITNSYGTSYSPPLTYASGVVGIAYNRYYEGQIDVFYVQSLTKGDSWNEAVFLGFPDGNHGQWPEMAADSLGNVATCWMDYLGSPYSWTGGIWVRVSHDSGQTWNDAIRLDSNYLGDVGCSVEIEGNYVAVCWAEETNPMTLHYRSSWDGGETWGADQILTTGIIGVPRLIKHRDNTYLIFLDNQNFGPNIYRFVIKYMFNEGSEDPSATEDSDILPEDYEILAYPNPFNSRVKLMMVAEKGGDEEFRIYDIGGRLIRTLQAEEGIATWDGFDESGQEVTSGIYFVNAGVTSGKITRRITFLK